MKLGGEDALAAAAEVCVAASRAETGVLRYDLWRQADGERRYVFDELYAHDAAVKAHMASNHCRVFGAAAETLASGPPTVVVTHPVDVE